ncbi:unnamed protein product [Haemonchus placei]|uniref:Endo/exonuclease/phosphatase domain-containing protein n=1 Tax=Haemonchus placei TaxID=6290 RepID=A0A0N4WJJ4_HAEPC|nr:unnamed protein product [Haemonchus placei]
MQYKPAAPKCEKDEFYLSLDNIIRSVPEGDNLTIGGDLNGHDVSEKRALERVHEGGSAGSLGDKKPWFWNDKVQQRVRKKRAAYKWWQKTRAPVDLVACRTPKRAAKAAIAKAKNMEMEALFEKSDGRGGDKFVFRTPLLLAAPGYPRHRDGEASYEHEGGCNREGALGGQE